MVKKRSAIFPGLVLALVLLPLIVKAQINQQAKKIDQDLPSRHLVKENGQKQNEPFSFVLPELDQKAKPVTVTMGATSFSRVFLLSEDGSTISSGIVASTHFIPTDNRIIVGQANYALRDSFNPFGTSTFEDAILYGAINSLISRFGKK